MKKTWRYKVRKIQIEGDIAYVPLTRGKVTIIDATDAAEVGVWNWCAMPAEGGKWYAYRSGIKRTRLQQFLKPSPSWADHRSQRSGQSCLNNRQSNLRFATPSQNSQNKARPRIGNGIYKGISAHSPNRWRARIKVGGVRLSLGSFASPEEAAAAYDAAAITHFGEFAVLNFNPRESR